MQQLHPRLAEFAPALIIFDKDGTLIDFQAMWGDWVTTLAQKLEAATETSIAAQLFSVMDFDPVTGHIAPGGHLAITPVANLKKLTIEVLRSAALSAQEIDRVMAAAWHTPNPVTLARPLTNLPSLFGLLQENGIKIAVATSDDRSPTEATLSTLGIASLIDATVCADDGLPIKPAPDMILTVCRQLKITPAQAAMVGDNPDDLRMGRAAGVGLTVGVLSGVGAAADLANLADLLLNSVANLTDAG